MIFVGIEARSSILSVFSVPEHLDVVRDHVINLGVAERQHFRSHSGTLIVGVGLRQPQDQNIRS